MARLMRHVPVMASTVWILLAKLTGTTSVVKIPCSKLQGIFDRKECALFEESHAYPAACSGECARFCDSKKIDCVLT